MITEQIAARVKKEKEEEKDDDEEQQEQSNMEAVNEFSKRLKALMKERKKEKEEEKEEEEKEEMKEEEKEEEKDEEKEEEEKKENDDEEEDLYDQPNISQGLGGVLSYLQSQHISDTYEEAYGRRTDSVIDSSNKDGRNRQRL